MSDAIREGDEVVCMQWQSANGKPSGFRARVLNLSGDDARVQLLEIIPKPGIFKRSYLIGQDFNNYNDIYPEHVGSKFWIKSYVLEKAKPSGSSGCVWFVFIVLVLMILNG